MLYSKLEINATVVAGAEVSCAQSLSLQHGWVCLNASNFSHIETIHAYFTSSLVETNFYY